MEEKSMSKTVSLRQCFADLHDPRREHGRYHTLWDILGLTISAVVSGADSWVDVENYGHCKLDWLKTFLALPNGIPAHDTIGRVFSLINPAAFQQCFLQWVNRLVEATEGRIIAIDGKTLRRSFDRAAGKGPLHVVSAWAVENHLTLGQMAVDGKSNEITAIPELLKILDLTGAIVTIDAMGCQKDIAAPIRAAGGDYVLALKDNQPTLYADVQQLFLAGLDNDFANITHHSCHTVDEGHGRVEHRYYHVIPVPEELSKKHPDWQDWRSVGMVYSERTVGKQETSSEVRFFINSLKPKVKTFARAVRGHWGIENSLHWVLDVSFREDESRLRKDHAPENLALVRRMAVALLKKETTAKGGIACKRKQAGWNNDYHDQILGARLR
jgi:predicted transposase YbfD/YdcC